MAIWYILVYGVLPVKPCCPYYIEEFGFTDVHPHYVHVVSIGCCLGPPSENFCLWESQQIIRKTIRRIRLHHFTSLISLQCWEQKRQIKYLVGGFGHV